MIQQTRAELDLHALVEEFFATSFATDNPLITEAVRRMLAAGGKRLRPRITLLSAQSSGANPREHLQLAAYMELIHVATLIHDDVVDSAQTRRGVNATAVDFGNRVSVLAGDYLFAWIFKHVTWEYPPPVPHILSGTLAEICDGEVQQLRAHGNIGLELSEYLEIVQKKTASLFAASAQCGAIMGGARAQDVEALRDFGLYFGIAFQMHDDLLDMTEDSRVLGKPAGHDLAERKVSIPLILALKAGDSEFRTEVERFYSGPAGDAAQPVIAGIARCGGLSATREQTARYVNRAKVCLRSLENSAARDGLTELADCLLD
ncbi:MAG: polyprenyl synthetase family protein [Candidatus Meridianibacter frigidus]|nr:MAG: polyprenyl synthetase family protein [Candidatus Eremiobacteraeota bacterium]